MSKDQLIKATTRLLHHHTPTYYLGTSVDMVMTLFLISEAGTTHLAP